MREPRDQEEPSADHDAPPASQPVFNIPASLVATLALMIAIFVVQDFVLDYEIRSYLVIELAFSPFRYVYPLEQQDFAWLWTPVTYSFLHSGIEHIAFNSLWLMAFGTPVVRRIGIVRYIAFWILSAAAAAFLHAALNWGAETLLVGASGVVSALMGAACRFAFPEGRGYDRLSGHLHPRQSVAGALTNRTVIMFTAIWMFGNVLIAFGVTLFGADLGPIAWDAHIGGFLFGFLFFVAFDPVRRAGRLSRQP